MRLIGYLTTSFHGLLRFMPAIKRISTFTFVDYYAFNQRIQYELWHDELNREDLYRLSNDPVTVSFSARIKQRNNVDRCREKRRKKEKKKKKLTPPFAEFPFEFHSHPSSPLFSLSLPLSRLLSSGRWSREIIFNANSQSNGRLRNSPCTSNPLYRFGDTTTYEVHLHASVERVRVENSRGKRQVCSP